ncbi:g9230 [Coccomyxa elongata]
MIRGVRQAVSLLQLRGVHPVRAFAGDIASTEGVVLSSGEIGIASGTPGEIFERKVLIYAPARTAGQQGKANTTGTGGNGPAWKLQFETQQKWENPLIGWTSTADPLENVHRATLNFHTQAEAEAFCQKHGWKYEVLSPKEQTEVRPKRYIGYGDNFSVKKKGIPQGGLKSEQVPAKASK